MDAKKPLKNSCTGLEKFIQEKSKETHAAEKFPTPPNTFLMVRFKCCFSMNIIDLRAHSFIPTPHPFKIYLV